MFKIPNCGNMVIRITNSKLPIYLEIFVVLLFKKMQNTILSR